MDVTDQIVSIFAGARGFLDDVDEDRVPDFEKALLEHFHSTAQNLWQQVAERKALDDELDKAMTEAIRQFKTSWLAAGAADA